MVSGQGAVHCVGTGSILSTVCMYVHIHPNSSEFRFVLRPAGDDVGNLCIPYYQHASCSCNISSRLLQDTIREHCRIGRYPTNQGSRDGVARVGKGVWPSVRPAWPASIPASGESKGDDPSLRNLRDLHTCIAAISLPCLGINPEATVCLDRAVDGWVTDKRVSLELF